MQYLAGTFLPAHPGNKSLENFNPMRNKKPTVRIFKEEVTSKFQSDLTYKETLKSLHTDSVKKAADNYDKNRDLDAQPPEINPEELTLSRRERVELATQVWLQPSIEILPREDRQQDPGQVPPMQCNPPRHKSSFHLQRKSDKLDRYESVDKTQRGRTKRNLKLDNPQTEIEGLNKQTRSLSITLNIRIISIALKDIYQWKDQISRHT